MRFYILLIVTFISVGTAYAKSSIPKECRFLPDYKPSADAVYKPGVDVQGKPVVPADVSQDAMGLKNQTIVMPLTIDFAQRLQNLNVAGLQTEGTLGFLEVSPDGRVTYNGQDLTQQVHAACAEKPLESAAPANGQVPADAVEYAPSKQ